MYNPLFLDDAMGDVPTSSAELTTGDWIALRRLAGAQSLTEAQLARLLELGLAEESHDGFVCSMRGRQTLQSRP